MAIINAGIFMKRADKMNHMFALLKEIDVLKERFAPHDTGHIRGAVRVLEERVQELRKELSLDE
jgi:hypothetical protein